MKAGNGMRMCISCRTFREKHELHRLVKIENRILVDESGKTEGRGAYLCKDPKCINACIKKGYLKKAFSGGDFGSGYEALEALLNHE